MEAQPRTRSEVLTASLARAEADLAAARQARASYDASSRLYRDLAAEQPQHQQWRYTNASVQFRDQADGMDREIGELLTLIEDLTRAIAVGNDVTLSAESVEGMDLTLDAVLA